MRSAVASDLILAIVCVVSLALAQDDLPITPKHRQILKDVREEAVAASLRAEGELLNIFEHEMFRFGLKVEGADMLSDMSSRTLLDKLKANLPSLEYTDNFGLDAMSRKLHPGREAMDLATIEKYGHIPTDWELKLTNSSLSANVSEAQWNIYDAAETGLYPYPEFADPTKPTASEILERPKYIAGNLRRMDTGLERYGAYSAVLRNDAVRNRAIFLAADSGGWENICNTSVKPIDPADRDWVHHLMLSCEPILAMGDSKGKRPVLGTADHQVHTILANARNFDRIGGGLPRLMHQMLTPDAPVRPIEVNMYTEATLMGPLRMVDLKLLVGSFPGLFGTQEGEELRTFCKKHGVPLAWGLGSGRIWPDEETRPGLLIPFEPFYAWKAGHARLLDVDAGWSATNVTAPTDAPAVWEKIWKQIVESRKTHTSKAGPGHDAFVNWWARLEEASGAVPPLRAGDCDSADLCFGTYSRAGGKDCVCRKSPSPAVIV